MGLTRGSYGEFDLNGVRVNPSMTGKKFYVHSGTGSNSSQSAGSLPDSPLADLDNAVSRCTANEGDVIYLMPGHVESSASAAAWDVDVAGVTVIGLGHGSARPRFDYDATTAIFSIGASGCVVKNIQLRPSVAAVVIGIDVETLVTDTLLDLIEVLPGEEGDGTDEFTLGIDIKVGCSRTTIRRFKYRQHASAGGTIAGVRLSGASDDILIEEMDANMSGAGLLAPINGITTLSTNVNIRHCVLTCDAAEPGIELLTGTTGVASDCYVFSNLATLNAAFVADGLASFNNQNVEVAPESGGIIGTATVND